MRDEGLFLRFLEETLSLTDQWCISDLVTLYASMNTIFYFFTLSVPCLDLKRYTREFQLQGNWTKMIEDIQKTLTAASPATELMTAAVIPS